MNAKYLIAALLLASAPAFAQAQTDAYGRPVTCSGAGPVTCSVDGATVTAPTIAAAITTLNGMAPASYVPPAPPPSTTIAPLDFMARLTPAEQTAIATASQSNAQILLFLLKLSGATQVDVTDPLTIAGVNAMVGAGLLTTPRGAQILDLSRASP
jgi:hypothetical protein